MVYRVLASCLLALDPVEPSGIVPATSKTTPLLCGRSGMMAHEPTSRYWVRAQMAICGHFFFEKTTLGIVFPNHHKKLDPNARKQFGSSVWGGNVTVVICYVQTTLPAVFTPR